ACVFKFIKGKSECLTKPIIKDLHPEFLNYQSNHIILECQNHPCCQCNSNGDSQPVYYAFYQVFFHLGARMQRKSVNDLSKDDGVIKNQYLGNACKYKRQQYPVTIRLEICPKHLHG